MFGKKMVDIVHELFDAYVSPGDAAVDATMGNGHDTLKLCRCVGDSGKVYAFDIQENALKATKLLLKENHMEDRAELILDSHEYVDQYVQDEIAAFVFNLGYLPKGDPSVVTRTDSTLTALQSCIHLLKTGGLGIVLAYYGHPGGEEEKNHVDRLLGELPSKHYDVLKLQNHNRTHTPPILYMLLKH